MNPYAEVAHVLRPATDSARERPTGKDADPLALVLSRAAFKTVAAVEDAVARLVERFRADKRRRLTIRELSALDDHTLRDIGLQRSQIRSVAHALAAGEEPGRGADDLRIRLLATPARPRRAANDNARDDLQSQSRAALSAC